MIKNKQKFLALFVVLVLLSSFLGSVPKQAQAASLISHWEFNGSTADSAGTNNGTLEGSASVANNYLDVVSSTADYVSVPDDDSLSFVSGGVDQAFSVSTWAKLDPAGSLSFLKKGNIDDSNLEYQFSYNYLGNVELLLYDDSHTPGNYISIQYALGNDYTMDYLSEHWMLLTATYDGGGASAVLNLYVNGSVVDAFSSGSNYDKMANGNGILKIGSASDGNIDDLRIYSGELTANEVSTLFSSQASDFRSTSIATQFLDADGNNVVAVSTPVNTAKVIFSPQNELNNSDGVLINFQSDFALGTIDDSSVAISQMHTTTDLTVETDGIDKSGQNVRIILDDTAGAGDRKSEQVTVTITDAITTPSAGTYIIIAETYDLGSDNAWGGVGGAADTLEGTASAAAFFGDYIVNISGSVDPTLTLTLANWTDANGDVATANTCNLSPAARSLTSAAINLCGYTASISTNATSGYIAYIRDSGDFSSGSDVLADATGTASMSANPADAIYGVATDFAGGGVAIQFINDVDGDTFRNTGDLYAIITNGNRSGVNASGITETDQSFAKSTEPADDTIVLGHMAAIAGDTPAGTYSTTTVITAVGNF
ncbi:MAG: hypothetical protein NTZ49_03395 [Candidatus Parcubacteria bacterium]|nr:hypothetical protein [Candidatus Parcubacteria bacterium]